MLYLCSEINKRNIKSIEKHGKQIPVMLYEHVPDFEEIWDERKAPHWI